MSTTQPHDPEFASPEYIRTIRNKATLKWRFGDILWFELQITCIGGRLGVIPLHPFPPVIDILIVGAERHPKLSAFTWAADDILRIAYRNDIYQLFKIIKIQPNEAQLHFNWLPYVNDASTGRVGQ